MPPALHPRSRSTLSLFTTTLALSFAVVGLPHLLPCPVPHNKRVYADGEMPGQRRRRSNAEETCSKSRIDGQSKGRECPVPKPSGLVGQILGFEGDRKNAPVIKVERFTGASTRDTGSKPAS